MGLKQRIVRLEGPPGRCPECGQHPEVVESIYVACGDPPPDQPGRPACGTCDKYLPPLRFVEPARVWIPDNGRDPEPVPPVERQLAEGRRVIIYDPAAGPQPPRDDEPPHVAEARGRGY